MFDSPHVKAIWYAPSQGVLGVANFRKKFTVAYIMVWHFKSVNGFNSKLMKISLQIYVLIVSLVDYFESYLLFVLAQKALGSLYKGLRYTYICTFIYIFVLQHILYCLYCKVYFNKWFWFWKIKIKFTSCRFQISLWIHAGNLLSRTSEALVPGINE